MSRTAHKVAAAAILTALLAVGFSGAIPLTLRFHEEVSEFAEMARALNVRNLVSAIYLGPRVADTFLEVMVVVLAVVGMRFIREAP